MFPFRLRHSHLPANRSTMFGRPPLHRRPKNMSRSQSRKECTGSGVNKCPWGFCMDLMLKNGSTRGWITNLMMKLDHPTSTTPPRANPHPWPTLSNTPRCESARRATRMGIHQRVSKITTKTGNLNSQGHFDGCFMGHVFISRGSSTAQAKMRRHPHWCQGPGARRRGPPCRDPCRSRRTRGGFRR